MSGLGEWRRAQRKARESNRAWNGGVGGRNPATSPMYGRRQAGREQPAVAISPPNGRFLRANVPAQTWNGKLDLGDVLQDAGWSGEPPVTGASDEWGIPAQGYYDLHIDLDVAETGVERTITVEVDGTPVWSQTVWIVNRLVGVIPTGPVPLGSTVTLKSSGAVTVSGGQSVMQLVDRQVGQVLDIPEVPPPGISETATYSGQSDSGGLSVSVTAPTAAEAGDLLVATFIVNSQSNGGNITGWSIPSSFTLAHSVDMGSSRRVIVATKTADATDANQGRSYSFTASGDFVFGSASCSRIPAVSVAPLGTPVVDTSTSGGGSVSATAPQLEYGWVLGIACFFGVGTVGSGTTINVTGASVYASHTAEGNTRQGRHRHLEAASGSSVTVNYGTLWNRAALVLLPVGE